MGSRRSQEQRGFSDPSDWTKDRESVQKEYHRIVPYAPSYDLENKAESTHALSPTMALSTDVPPLRAFTELLELLSEAHFEHIDGYAGPRLGIAKSRKDPPDIKEAVAALREVKDAKDAKDAKVPWGGMMARVTYGPSKKSHARIVVKGSDPTRVRIKVKGPIRKSDWAKVRRLTKERLDARE
jgi:hypothetical protein